MLTGGLSASINLNKDPEVKMAKNNDRNLNVTIKNAEEDKDEVVISMSAIMKKLKKYFLPWIIIAAMLGALIVSLKTVETIRSKPPLTALVSFSYDGVEKGLDPHGKTFDVNTLKNPEVIKNALTELDIDLAKIETVRQNITVAGVIPADAIDRITAYKSVMDKTPNNALAAADAVLDVSYFPTQYKVTFNYGATGLSSDKAVQVLNTTLDKYRDYFYKEYGYNETLGAAVATIKYSDYDYPEAVDLFRSTLTTLSKYIKGISNSDTTHFRSSSGYTFDDLYETIKTIRSLDLDKAESLITVNNITKNKQDSIDYYQFRIDSLTREKDADEESYKAVVSAKETYEKDKLLVMQNSDGANQEISKNSEEYDNLVKQEVSLAASIAETRQQINFYETRKEALKKASNCTQAQIDDMEKRLEGVNAKVNDIVEKTKAAAEEYYEDVEFANAYKLLVPAANSKTAGIKIIIKNSLKKIILAEAFLFFIYFGIAFVTALIEENKKKPVKAAAGSTGGDGDDDDDDDDDIDEVIEEVAEAIGAEAEKTDSNTSKKNKKK